METLEFRIKAFLSATSCHGDGYGYSYRDGCGSCHGDGCGYGYGAGYGYGDGCGAGSCYCHGAGSCDGHGAGCGAGYGYGAGDGDGVKVLNGENVHLVDDLTLQPCYIVKENNKFAHGDTLHDAFTSLREKLYNDSTEEERIEAFVKKFPNYDAPYSNRDLFAYHHVLTGSCRMGRESFCKDKGINLDGSTTVRDFVSLTKDSYGSETIRMLPQAYEVNL